MNKIGYIIFALTAMLCVGCAKQVTETSSPQYTSSPASLSADPNKQPLSESSSDSNEETPADKADLLKQADIITAQLVAYSFTDAVLKEKVVAPTALAINSFILTVPIIKADNYMYKDFVHRAELLPYEYPADKVVQLAYELFGKSDWILEGGDAKLDETKNAYLTGLEFCIGDSLFSKDVSSEFSAEDTRVVSKFILGSNMAFDEETPGDPVTKEYGKYQIIYDVMKKDNRSFLRFVAMEKL